MTITIDSLYTYKTYGGCLEGIPDPEIFIKIAKDKATQLFGQGRPVLVLEPELINVPPVDWFEGGKLLPQWTHLAYCNSYDPPKEGDFHGSHCVVIWFSSDANISEASYEILNKFDWDKNARGWCL